MHTRYTCNQAGTRYYIPDTWYQTGKYLYRHCIPVSDIVFLGRYRIGIDFCPISNTRYHDMHSRYTCNQAGTHVIRQVHMQPGRHVLCVLSSQ